MDGSIRPGRQFEAGLRVGRLSRINTTQEQLPQTAESKRRPYATPQLKDYGTVNSNTVGAEDPTSVMDFISYSAPA